MSRRLVTGGATDQFLPHLLAAIERASRIDIAVAFVKSTGLGLIFDSLYAALTREEPARVRFLASDYLDVTDPQALGDLLSLTGHGLSARLFRTAEIGFHLKAYVFGSSRTGDFAWVGSSNLSRAALTETLEWNLRVEEAESAESLAEIR